MTSERGTRVERAVSILRNRKEYLEEALEFLESAELIDRAGRKEVERLYERGDAATKKALGTLAEKVRTLDIPGLAELDLSGLDLKNIDLDRLIAKLRSINPLQLLYEGAAASEVVTQAVEKVPEALWRFQLRMALLGLVLVGLAAAGLVFPEHGPLILYYGLLVLLVVVGAWLMVASVRMDRALKRWDIDLVVLRRLSPDERKALLLHRLVKRVATPERVKRLVEKGKEAVREAAEEARNESERPPAPTARGEPAEPEEGEGPWWERAKGRLKGAGERVSDRLRKDRRDDPEDR